MTILAAVTGNASGDPAEGATAEVPTLRGRLVWEPTVSKDGESGESVIVRFAEGVTARRTEAGLVVKSPGGEEPAETLRGVLARRQILEIAPLFKRPVEDLEKDRARAKQRTGQPQPDLTLFFRLTLHDEEDAVSLATELDGLRVVETAYVAPKPAPPPNPTGDSP